MTSAISHERIRESLERELPPHPVLLLGPSSTGKWTTVTQAAERHAAWFNRLSLAEASIDDIRDLREFLSVPAAADARSSAVKVVTINLDGAKSSSVQHALLKDLEEAPGYARFMLTASAAPLRTIVSRCAVWRWGLLTDDEVAQILVSDGLPQKDAVAIAPAGRGQVAPARAAAERFRSAKGAVLGVARAIMARDSELFERAVRTWGDMEDWMLRELLFAAASGNATLLFTVAERQVIGKTVARRGTALLTASFGARPKVSVRVLAAALMSDGG